MDLNHGIIFKSLWAGSLAGQADPQLVFIFLIAHSDPDDCVDIHPGVISALTGLPPERVRSALDYLESDDPQSRNPDHDGCRIKRLDTHRDWGWMVLNRPAYKALFTKEKKLRADRDGIAGKRSVAKCRKVSQEVASVAQAVGSRQYAVGTEELSPTVPSEPTETATPVDFSPLVSSLSENLTIPRGKYDPRQRLWQTAQAHANPRAPGDKLMAVLSWLWFTKGVKDWGVLDRVTKHISQATNPYAMLQPGGKALEALIGDVAVGRAEVAQKAIQAEDARMGIGRRGC